MMYIRHALLAGVATSHLRDAYLGVGSKALGAACCSRAERFIMVLNLDRA